MSRYFYGLSLVAVFLSVLLTSLGVHEASFLLVYAAFFAAAGFIVSRPRDRTNGHGPAFTHPAEVGVESSSAVLRRTEV
jgi:hypothetical protein